MKESVFQVIATSLAKKLGIEDRVIFSRKKKLVCRGVDKKLMIGAYCSPIGKKRYKIVIDSSIRDREVVIGLLVHEIAHVLCFRRRNPHGNGWGRAYARAYRACLDMYSDWTQDKGEQE